MNSKIEKSFQNSQFYRNYNNINTVILKFEKIKNEYKSSKNKYENEMITIVNALNKNQMISTFPKEIIDNFYNKFGSIDFEKEYNDLFYNKINIDDQILNSYRKILNEKINISHNIKKYVKYSKNINDDFIKSVEIGNISNINILIKNGADIHTEDDYALRFSSENGQLEVVKFLVGKGANIHAYDDDALILSSCYGNIEIVKFLVENGANIYACDDNALKMSSLNGNIDVVQFLVKNGANTHVLNDISFIYCMIVGRIDVVKFLVRNRS